jgi:hypothetical protein
VDYESKVQEQIQQYEKGFDPYPLPPIFHHWSHTYLRQKVAAVFGTQTVTEFYASQFSFAFETATRPFFVSIGSGDGAQEIAIAKSFIAKGHNRFNFLCLDLNPTLVDNANQSIKSNGLEELVSSKVFDINKDSLGHEVHGFMAHQSLHHFVELERTFDLINGHLVGDGRFLTQDIIGRNGHMRWPEALLFVDAVWEKLPDHKRYNHQHKKNVPTFVNHDCSTFGFEGIRSQDILPLMVERFSFERFLGAGGFIDVFVDRDYGPNFNPKDDGDRLLIDTLESINDVLVDLGVITPTMMFASVMKKRSRLQPIVYRNRTPEFCVRNPSDPSSMRLPFAQGGSRSITALGSLWRLLKKRYDNAFGGPL